jgi:phosphoadenosine phosphosulfate reductase
VDAVTAIQTDLLCGEEQRWERLERLSIARLQTFEPEEGYILAYSGGKDSDVLLALAKAAGVRYEAHYHATTIDPPEVVRHVRAMGVTIDKPKRSMVALIERKGLPSRWRRWCCSELKERPWPGRVVLTGVRWAESPKRSARSMIEVARSGKGQRFLHPIIDWAEADVWGYLRARGVSYCRLYDEGQKRIGCVCCPLNPKPRDAERWPQIAGAMRRAWLRFCAAKHPGWLTGGEAERTWVQWIATGRATQTEPEVDDGCPLFADARDEP